MRLSNENIAKTSQEIQDFFEKAGISKKDRLKMSFVLEEALLRFQEHFGNDYEFKITMIRWFTPAKVKIRIKGKPFNPLEETESDEEPIFSPEIMQSLMHYENAGTAYRYENGYNEITAFSTKEQKAVKIPGGSITVAILLAITCAFSVKFLPQNV